MADININKQTNKNKNKNKNVLSFSSEKIYENN